MSKAKRFSCMQCGTPFEVYPPDDRHPTASLDKPKDPSGTIKEMTFVCKNEECKHPTTLYWYRQKMHVAVV